MGLIDIASGSSAWRGLDYYNEKRVTDYKKINDYQYEGIVKGSNKAPYKAELKEALIETLNIAPEWVYDRFTRDRVLIQEYLKRYVSVIIIFYNKNSLILQICVRPFLMVRNCIKLERLRNRYAKNILLFQALLYNSICCYYFNINIHFYQ